MAGDVERWAVWNTLHDGVIIAADGSVPGDVRLSIEIGYLCKMLPTASDRLTVRLLGCSSIHVKPFEDQPSTDIASLVGQEVLSVNEAADGMVVVNCVEGLIELGYAGVSLQLAEGTSITQAELEAAANRYWTEWEARHKRSSGKGP